MATPVNSNIVLLKPRTPTNVGSLTALNARVQFSCPDLVYRGQLNISVPSGSVSTPPWLLQASASNGNSWFGISGTTFTLTGLFTGDSPAVYASRHDIGGLAVAQFPFGLTAGASISRLAVWVLVG
jgi:hypothetical protein